MLIRFLVFLSLAGAVWAQTRDTAAVFGSVIDPQGAAIPGAVVTLTSVGTGVVRTVTTDESGRYGFNLLPVGSYQLGVEQGGLPAL